MSIQQACMTSYIIPAIAALIFLGPTGCPSSQEDAQVISLLQTGLSDLQEDRGLVEQFVRDVKTNIDPSDPAYQQAEESYDNARDAYNRFLDSIESEGARSKSRSLRSSDAALNARDAAAEFVADATAALKPSISTRRIQFRRAVVIPDNFERTLQLLPGRDREVLVDRFDRQVRWSSWGQL